MPEYSYRARDKQGQLRTGTRFANSVDTLSTQLIHEGIFPIEIKPFSASSSWYESLQNALQGESGLRDELSIFCRQMKLLQQAGVPMVTALNQLASHTRSIRLKKALEGVVDNLEKGQSLASAMQQYPRIFSPLMVNIIRIGENTGHLSEAFSHIHEYLAFESSNIKQIKTALRYPSFVLISIIFSIITLNVFVIPSFGHFYETLSVGLPWQTRLLITSSNLTTHYGIYLLIATVIAGVLFWRYIHTDKGSYKWSKFILTIPVSGPLLKRIILIRFAQSLAIMLNSGLSVTQALNFVKEVAENKYITIQINDMLKSIERGTAFTQAISKMDLLSPLEIQILSVGEKNGELGPALTYIAHFHSEEISFDIKRMSDLIGPIMLGIASGLVLIIALGVYLPIWNMINLVH